MTSDRPDGSHSGPRVSVVVPTHERPALLAEALDSIRGQTFVDFECVVVDDCSGTALAVIPDDPRFRCIELTERRGESGARNAGVEAARGEILCFLDDDDVYLPHRLEMVERHESGLVTVCWAGMLGAKRQNPGRILDGDASDEILDSFAPHLSTVMIDRGAMVSFDESLPAASDVDWWYRTTQRLNVRTIPEFGVMIRRHDGPRFGNGTRARLESSERLRVRYADYFARHRSARAFRLYREGWMLADLGRRRDAVARLARSVTTRPTLRAGRALVATAVTGRPSRPRS